MDLSVLFYIGGRRTFGLVGERPKGEGGPWRPHLRLRGMWRGGVVRSRGRTELRSGPERQKGSRHPAEVEGMVGR